MSPLPTGTVTFLFTDVEASTKLWQEHPEAMKRALGRHHALLEAAITSSRGYVFQIVGDAFCAAFHTPQDSLAAAGAAQRALTSEPWGEVGSLRVRMAVHTGTAEVNAGDYTSGEYASGLTLSRASRLLAAAHGGQVLVSQATEQLVREQLPPTTALRDLGEVRLRDLPRAENVYQLVAPGLATNFPAPRAADVVPNNLPAQLTSFIGRTREKEELTRLMTGARLLTVTGPGGSGKTRLSLELAADLLGQYPGGVWLIELAALADSSLVPQAVALALGVREQAGRPWLATLVEHLHGKQALFVLDNCEHVIDACAQLADALLRACPGVKILATSREPLGTAGEVTFRVPSLSLPDPRRLPPSDQLRDYEAIRLFIDRAGAAKPGFAVTEANAGAVAQICHRLDGIPLAIELAAARVRGLSVQQITSHLDARFRLLTGGSRTALPRHQTLRGLIDWSHELLPETERALFRRMSVFSGGWTLEAAVAVCAGDDLDGPAVADILGRLVDKFLVVPDEQAGEGRYRLLETIRQYGLERLAEHGESEAVRDRHRDFYLTLAEEAEKRLQGGEQAAWLARLEADHDNLRTALRWSLDRRQTEQALRLGSALWPFWDTHGYVSEGFEWLRELLALGNAAPDAPLTRASRRARARVLDGVAYLHARRSEIARARDLFTQSVQGWRELDDPGGLAEALNNAGHQEHLLGDRARGRMLIEESLSVFRRIGSPSGTAHALINLAEILAADGDHASARALVEQSVPMFRATEDMRGLAHALENLGRILVAHGEDGQAEGAYRDSLRLAERLDDPHGIATALRGLGGIAHRQHDHARARGLYQSSIDRFRSLNDRVCLARSLIACALTSHGRGDHGEARGLADEGLRLLRDSGLREELALDLAQLGRAALAHQDVERATRFLGEGVMLSHELGHVADIPRGLEGFAAVAAAGGRHERTARLLAAASTLRVARGIPWAPSDREAHEEMAGVARAGLEDAGFETAWTEGAAMPLDRAIAYAVGPERADAPRG